MFNVLNDLRVVEASSFIAAPSCGLHLAQMGAEVIRIDPIGGGPDFNRWPISPDGHSFYWEGLNKGKKSVVVDLGRPEGRELAKALITAPGENGGLFVTNFPVEGFLSHAELRKGREDLITLRVMGWADGTSAVDYTVNAALGVPDMTGPVSLDEPVNHVLPAWDLLTGAYGAYALLAAERQRLKTGAGGEILLPLSDVALAALGNLGQFAEIAQTGLDRPRYGNQLFGAFGRDFLTRDGQRMMIVAITRPQWKAMIQALGLQDGVARIEAATGVSFAVDEGLRFIHREQLSQLVGDAVAKRTQAELETLFKGSGVCWSRYQGLKQAIETDPRMASNPILAKLDHPSGYRYQAPGTAANFTALNRTDPRPAARLGEHTDIVLETILGLAPHQIGRLHDERMIAGPNTSSRTQS